MKKGFTLTEFLIVIVIIGVLALIIFPYYFSAQKQLALQRSVNKLAQDIRKVQGMALSAEEWEGVSENGFGIYLRKKPSPQTSYILFADRDGDKKLNFGSDPNEEIFLENGIKIKNLPANHVNIVFKPPKPEVYFKDNDLIDLGSEITIEISLIDDESKSKRIIINKAGLISVEQ